MTIIETLAQVQADGKKPFTAGIVLQGPVERDRELDVVVEAAPILRRIFKNQTRRTVRRLAADAGWRVVVVWQMERHLP